MAVRRVGSRGMIKGGAWGETWEGGRVRVARRVKQRPTRHARQLRGL